MPGHVGLMPDPNSPRKWTWPGWCSGSRRRTNHRSRLIPVSPPLVPPPPPRLQRGRGRTTSTTDFQFTKGDTMSLLGTRPVPEQTADLGHQMSSRNEKKAHALGLTSATGLVIGSIVGTGVFTMPAVLAGAGTMGIVVLAVIAVGAHAAGRAVRPAHQAGAQQRRRALRLLPPRVRRLRRLPRRLVLLDPGLGRQRGHRRRRGCSTSTPCSASATRRGMENWGIALVGLWVPGRRQPGRGSPDGVVPERHRRPEVPAAAVRRRRRLVLRHARPTSARSTPRAGASTAASGSPPAWRCSPSSASRRRRSPPSG